jgi:hypothetical protein
MRKMVIAALFGLPLLPGTIFAQTNPGPQMAAVEASPRTTPAAPNVGAVTREQYVQHAQDRAAQRAAARFDQWIAITTAFSIVPKDARGVASTRATPPRRRLSPPRNNPTAGPDVSR